MTRRPCLAIALLASTALALPSFAQSVPSGPAPLHNTVDANGVDLVTGQFRFGMTEAVMGSGEGAVSLSRYWGDGAFRDNWSGGVYVGPSNYTYVDQGQTSESFTNSGGTYTSRTGNGATLVAAGSTFQLTASDGTVTDYTTAVGEYPSQGYACPAGAQPNGCALPVAVTRPNGLKFTITWDVFDKCDLSTMCETGTTFYRFRGVTSSIGYGFTINYLTNNPGTGSAPQTNWYKKTSVTFSNSVTTCDSSCPAITYPVPSSTPLSFANALGETWQFTSNGQITGIRRPGETVDSTTIAYGTSGVSSVTVDGVTTTYSRSVAGNVVTTTITNALSQSKIVTADSSLGRITSVQDELGRTTSYQYDTLGRLTRITAPEGNYTQYAYDARGNVTTTTSVAKSGSGLANIVTSASFDATCSNPKTCNNPNTTTDARGNVTNYGYDATHGGLTVVTRPAPTVGAVRPEARISYTSTAAPVAGNPNIYLPTSVSQCQTTASCAGAADEAKVTATYAGNLLPATVSSGAGNGSLTATSAFTYDPAGNRLTVDGPLTGTADTTRYRYDAARRPIGVTSPDPDGAGAMKMRAVRITYRPDSQVSKQELGTVNSQSDPDWANFATLQAVDLTYDSNARPVTAKLSSGATSYALSQTSYDALGRIDCTALRMNTAIYGSLPASACTLGTEGSFGPDQITKIVYDNASQPVQNIVAYGTTDQATERTLTYSSNGRLATLKDGENNLTTYEYDGFDRLSKTRYPVTTKGANASSTTDYEQSGYDASSNVASRRLRDAQTIAYTYDNLDRLTFKNLPGSEPDVTLAYDNLNRPTSASKTGSTISFTYDALSRRLTEVGAQGTVTSEYDLANRRTKITYPGTGLFVNYDYLVTGETSKIRENGATTGIGVLATFTYDNLGNRTNLAFGNGASQSYSLDPVSRLSSLTANLSGTANDLTIGSIAYSPASQITSLNRSNDSYAWNGHYNENRNYTANGLNQFTASGAVVPTYDTRGNLTSAGTTTYTYSSENMLTATSTGATLGYDPLLRLTQVAAGATTTKFAYDGLRALAEYDGSNLLLRRFVFGPGLDEALVQYEGTGTTTRRFLHADERGSIVAVSNASGAIFAKNAFDEYGIPSSSNYGRFQYTGQMWLPELGMYHYKARTYSPTLGRFLQTDPIGYDDGLNWYNYVGGDPVNFVDPLGLCGPDKFEKAVATDPANFVPDAVNALYRIVCVDKFPSGGSSGGVTGGGGGGARHRKQPPQSDQLPCQKKSLAVQLGEGALDGLGLLGDGAQVLGAYTGFVPLAAAGTAAEYISIGGSALLHWSTGDIAGLAEDGLSFAAGAVPGGRIARKVGGAAADWGRRSNGQLVQGSNRKQKAQNAAYSSGQSTAASGGSLCPVKSG